MIGRTSVARGAATALGVLVCAGAGIALTPTTALACPNEQLRGESRVNPVTQQAYSTGLPDCRAYEMVSPLYKASHDVLGTSIGAIKGVPVAPDGQTAGFTSQGAFAEPEAEVGGTEVFNFYTARRGVSGWITSSAFPPVRLIPAPSGEGLSSDFSPDLHSVQAACGATPLGKVENIRLALLCARKLEGGSWVATAPYQAAITGEVETSLHRFGASSDLSRILIGPVVPLLPEDELPNGYGPAIYEIAGLGSQSPRLRLVNVDNKGLELFATEEKGTGFRKIGPLVGDARLLDFTNGTAFHAMSESGLTVFFGASAQGSLPTQHTQALYARVHCPAGSPPPCKEYPKGSEEDLETLEVSAPFECPACASTPQAPAVFEGASADGSRVFFTTTRTLVTSATTEGRALYEFNLTTRHLALIAGGTPGAEVTGVVRTSSDGSHVYFATIGALKTKIPAENENTWQNGEGKEEHEKASEKGEENVYGYDTETGEVRFVASGPANSFHEIRGDAGLVSTDLERHAQTTPDGLYLVFSSPGALAGNTNGPARQAVYRYAFDTGKLTWVSHAAAGANPNEGKDATVAPFPGKEDGDEADGEDWNRAISGCPNATSEAERERCPPGHYDGEYVIFTTTEQLQANDVNNAPDLYEWHNGAVSMISDGRDPSGAGVGAVSASGSDIFFFTHTPLVGQDTDGLQDLYDARTFGGFAAPAPPPSCSGEACQGAEKEPPPFNPIVSSGFPASGNGSAVVVASPGGASPGGASPGGGSLGNKGAALTRAQKLAKALKACRAKPKSKRNACEAQARKRYGAKKSATRHRGSGR